MLSFSFKCVIYRGRKLHVLGGKANQESKKQLLRARGRHANLVGRVRWPPAGTPRPWAGLGLQGAWTELSPPRPSRLSASALTSAQKRPDLWSHPSQPLDPAS